MTTLRVLGSGSRGNCIALEDGGATLLLDAGFSAKEIEHRAAQCDLDLSTLVGIAVTHEHGDHAKGAARLSAKYRVPVIGSPGTLEAIAAPQVLALRPEAPLHHAGFTLEAATTSHDAAEPLAIAAWGASGARVGLAVDLGRPTTTVRYLLQECAALVIEANHDEVLLRQSEYPATVRARIAGAGGHLSNRQTGELLTELCHPHLGLVVLAHLSERCNAPDAAREAARAALDAAGFLGRLEVAPQHETLGPFGVYRTLTPELGV
ncbi:MAG TPA: MBL fold metallo-hydrolase [Gemmatimonadales bacterium]|nr:MBL fold metallo-hydrolase [Gemmatimonadales bacterium]